MQEQKSLLPESIKAIANMLEEIRRVQKEAGLRLSDHTASLEKLEAELQRQIYVQERQAKEIYKLKQELDLLKSAKTTSLADAGGSPKTSAVIPEPQIAKAMPEDFFKAAAAPGAGQHYISASVPLNSIPEALPQNNNSSETVPVASPIMPGSGFSNITVDYLKKMGQK